TDGCRMEYLQRSLDDETAAPCGRCDNCAGAWYPIGVEANAAASASAALDQVGVVIEPRAQWPTGADRLGVPVKGRISANERMREGRALARLTDLGWGGTMRELFAAGAADAEASSAMVAACVRVLADWGWETRPAAVVTMPSRGRPRLIESVAAGLSEAGRLPRLGSVEYLDGGPTGESGGTRAYR